MLKAGIELLLFFLEDQRIFPWIELNIMIFVIKRFITALSSVLKTEESTLLVE